MEPGGYAWWYVDALSDDRRFGLTIIAFVGSVFSPYYAFARRRGNADPEQHCAINVALYGASGKRWAMTERGQSALTRTHDAFSVGPSALVWDGEGLTITIEETTFPIPGRLRGVVRVRPKFVLDKVFDLHASGRHRWRPIAPLARAEVEFDEPNAKWSGSAYFDHNAGSEPLEAGFKSWNWSRTSGGATSQIYYDTLPRSGPARALAVAIDDTGHIESCHLPARQPLPSTLWRISRGTHGDAASTPRVVETLEDTPFYSRSLVETQVSGSPLTLFHESLDLDRFANPIVQCMLACRMPRRAHWQR